MNYPLMSIQCRIKGQFIFRILMMKNSKHQTDFDFASNKLASLLYSYKMPVTLSLYTLALSSHRLQREAAARRA